MNTLTHLSLFSGIGGLDLAGERAGFRTVGQCEWADFPRAVLEKHWPGLPRWRDIRTLTKESFYEQTGLETVTVLSGGFPCQPFSTAGKRRGKEDDRYLWPEMLRVISEIRPRWVVGENVAGLVSMVESKQNAGVEGRNISILPDEIRYEATWIQQENMLLVELIESLERIGYEVQPFIIPACAAGAPHRRDRIALAAHSNSSGHLYRGAEKQSTEAWEYAQREPVGCSTDVADTQCVGLRKDSNQSNSDIQRNDSSQKQIWRTELCQTGCCSSYVPNTDNQRLQTPGYEPGFQTVQPKDGIKFGGWWSAEPDVGRVAHGVPNRLDRLKCLGNAVVPQQFYPIFRAIAELEMQYEHIT